MRTIQGGLPLGPLVSRGHLIPNHFCEQHRMNKLEAFLPQDERGMT